MSEVDRSCNHTELIARVVALETGLTALRHVLDERDVRYSQRATAQDRSVATALEAAEKAIAKAEMSTEKRFDSVNEFRATLADQASLLLPRAEFTVQHASFVDKLDILEKRIGELQQNISAILARGGGLKDAWGYLVAGAGVILAGIALYFHSH